MFWGGDESGIALEQSARPKSDLYCDLLPLLNAKRIELDQME
jgi:hypothetical protein